MKRTFVIASILALAAAGAVQAETTVGRIATINNATHKVELRDGVTYDFNNSDAKSWLSGYQPGDSVRIDWSGSGDVRHGLSISSTSAFQKVGKVAAVDEANRTVTLADKNVYTFERSNDVSKHLNAFRPGDQVRIAYATEDGKLVGKDIGSTSSDEVTGMVSGTNVTNRTITLSNGMTYKLEPRLNAETMLGGVKQGDRVSVILIPNGQEPMVESISPITN